MYHIQQSFSHNFASFGTTDVSLKLIILLELLWLFLVIGTFFNFLKDKFEFDNIVALLNFPALVNHVGFIFEGSYEDIFGLQQSLIMHILDNLGKSGLRI